MHSPESRQAWLLMKSKRRKSGWRHIAACVLTFTALPLACRAAEALKNEPLRAFVVDHCTSCHDADTKKGNFDLASINAGPITTHVAAWEKVVRRLRPRQMPPSDKKRPSEAAYVEALSSLEAALDAHAAAYPNPGRTEALRRLNRTEYQNAIRDLLALEIDAATLLPKEEAGHGFDNVTVGTLSPTLLDRYITAAQKISQLAVGGPMRAGGEAIRLRPDLTQEEHVEGLPLGTRGGALIHRHFPHDAEYEIQVRLARDRNEEIEGLHESHDLELLLDGVLVRSFAVTPPKGHKNYELVDQHLKVRTPITAGPHEVGVTFVRNGSSLPETRRKPYEAAFNMHRHPRRSPAIYQVSINGPYSPSGPGETPSRRRIFVEKPARPEEEEACARQILSTLMRRAYRRAVRDEDLARPMALFRVAHAERGFDAGIEAGLSAILVSPNFLFRLEQDPPAVAPGSVYQISDVELASRLSFFIWSSIPDDELLDTAIQGKLRQADILEKQVRRMLASPRAQALASNFGGQWLYLRNLEAFFPDLRLFPDFDDNLRQALRRETELFFSDLMRSDRSVLGLLKSDYTFLNERLARHYDVPHVHGDRFRRVTLAAESRRGGLLRQGSILAVTSYANRTSPVIRGQWVLANLVGTPAPPPLPDVPALKDNTVSSSLSVRERLAEHRANAACASCHNLMDPVGFSLENFDAVGRWRTMEDEQPVDVSGGLPDGSKFAGISGLEEALLQRPDVFVSTLTEKLLTFALGRGIEHYDAPAVRKIVRDAKAADYRFSAIVLGVAQSTPFTMRKSL